MGVWPGEKLWNSLMTLAVTLYYQGGQEVNNKPLPTSQQYDFIVVGGGAAGAIVASKLSENPQVSVLLLESGGAASNVTDVPYLWYGLSQTELVKNYYSEIQSNGACYQSYCQMPFGNILGGGTSINGMLYVRGNKLDYNEWAAGGAEGWSYNEMLPYMKALEDFEGKEHGDDRGSGGYIHVTSSEGVKFYQDEAQRWVNAINEAGHSFGDYNGERQAVMSFSQKAVRNGVRESTENVFLRRQMIERSNLHVRLFSRVIRILFSDQRAIGVEYISNNNRYQAYTLKEVIVSAGTLSSPHLLMLSGVGERSHLEYYGIPVVADVPDVGQNFQDHVHNFLQYETDVEFDVKQLDFSDATYTQWVNTHDGVLSSTSGIGIGFFTRNTSTNNDDVRVQYNHGVGYQWRNNKNLMQINMLTDVTKPLSKGSLRLRSSNYIDQPLIYPNYLSDPMDKNDLVFGLKEGIRIFNTKTYRAINAKLITPDNVCTQFSLWSEDFVECYAQITAKSSLHYTSTCRMGHANDENAVVDPQLRVRKVSGLRVVDASVLPTVPRGNVVVPTMLVGLKASDMIKRQYGI